MQSDAVKFQSYFGATVASSSQTLGETSAHTPCTLTTLGAALDSVFAGSVTLSGNNGRAPLRVLIDSGAGRNLISTEVAEQLDLPVKKADAPVVFTFANGTSQKSHLCCPKVALSVGEYSTVLDLHLC